jgi:hypothetical protein
MAKPKYDGIIQAVHYQPDGQVGWVRAFLRRGPTFSDYILLDRQTLIQHLKDGKRYWIGQRTPQLASTFEVTQPLRLFSQDGKDFLVAGEGSADRDTLKGVPVI